MTRERRFLSIAGELASFGLCGNSATGGYRDILRCKADFSPLATSHHLACVLFIQACSSFYGFQTASRVITSGTSKLIQQCQLTEMDPLSISASAAGLASLSFQPFAGCVQGFIILSTAHNLGKDASTIVCMLNIQETHLTEWGRRAGLLTGDGQLDKRLNAPVVEQILQMLRGLLLDTKQLKKRYKLDLVEKPATAQPHLPDIETLTLSDTDKIFTGISDQTRHEVLFHARLIQNKNAFPKRLWWAAVDKERIEQLVDKIQFLVRELWFLLDPWRQDDLLHSVNSI